MNIGISGATGFIGKSLVNSFRSTGHQVTVISRQDFNLGRLKEKLENLEVIINLAGESIEGRWTVRKKKRIYNSRIQSAKMLVEAVNLYDIRLKAFVNISAVGIYDDQQLHREDSTAFSRNFLTKVLKDWESQLQYLGNPHIRQVLVRAGIVLGKEGGILGKILRMAKFGVGVHIRIDKGLPFIHLKDLIRIFDHVLQNHQISGTVNAVAPVIVDTSVFFSTLNAALKPKLIIPVYGWMIKLILGQSAVLLTEGQKVIPETLTRSGFRFHFPDLESTFKDILT